MLTSRWFQLLVFYLSYLIVLVFAGAFYCLSEDGNSIGAWIVFFLSLWFLYARFIETKLIKIRREKFQNERIQMKGFRVALISDLHMGVFKGEKFLKRVVKKINSEKPDFVIIAGDLINEPSNEQLFSIFRCIKDINVPIMAVTGNHDCRMPGTVPVEEVREVLKPFLLVIDNDFAYLNSRKTAILGFSDLDENKIKWELLDNLRKDYLNIVVAHNPDTAYLIKEKYPVDLVLAGHTHGGQIFLPPLSDFLIPCKNKFRRGWYQVNGRSVYVSSGLGEVILPMRFLLPPEIVIMDIQSK